MILLKCTDGKIIDLQWSNILYNQCPFLLYDLDLSILTVKIGLSGIITALLFLDWPRQEARRQSTIVIVILVKRWLIT